MPATDRAIELCLVAARAAAQKKAEEIIAIDVSERLVLTDAFLIVSAANDRQVRAVVDAIDEAMLQAGARRQMREGLTEAHWVLVDYQDLVVHVQQAQDREFYDLERLWKDCPRIALPPMDGEDEVAGQDSPVTAVEM
ncbi:ribosome silencing factor [Actinomyces bowdenii]|uniref:Ribosomal silencing factor RsfS n=1 Tax=Actinomyces bowdenii TaxID=131109 RepID=A0A853EJ41_9ACTO|nr:ribosome silencing factor [Actinomyces bowdenii]MBF0696612.1 ribosome silencing factor [Actinomyces bowdenii]MDO5063698.1 ribosome silencing factor [Actinomyces bowdenii]NYS68785.1 ribosome silencing factor [Actinomyces bowdenii]